MVLILSCITNSFNYNDAVNLDSMQHCSAPPWRWAPFQLLNLQQRLQGLHHRRIMDNLRRAPRSSQAPVYIVVNQTRLSHNSHATPSSTDQSQPLTVPHIRLLDQWVGWEVNSQASLKT